MQLILKDWFQTLNYDDEVTQRPISSNRTAVFSSGLPIADTYCWLDAGNN